MMDNSLHPQFDRFIRSRLPGLLCALRHAVSQAPAGRGPSGLAVIQFAVIQFGRQLYARITLTMA